MKCLLVFIVIVLPITFYSQSFEVKDRQTGLPVENVSISFSNNDKIGLTNTEGEFNLSAIENSFQITIKDRQLDIFHTAPINITLFDINGRSLFQVSMIENDIGYHHVEWPSILTGIYFIKIESLHESVVKKIFYPYDGQINYKTDFFKSNITLKKDGYYDLTLSYKALLSLIEEEGFVYIVSKSNQKLKYLTNLPSIEYFNLLKGKPFNQTNTNVHSVKLLYDLQQKMIYYFNADLYLTHFDFAFDVLHYPLSKQQFSAIELSYNDRRRYIPATINYYDALDIFVLEFSSFCEVGCKDAQAIYGKMKEHSLFKNKTLLLLNANEYLQNCDLPKVDPSVLYGSQQYQPLSLEENFGYLRMVDIDSLDNIYLGPQDILLTNEIPSDINVIAGLITTVFQTPLSHVNVLSHNRRTPNMALKKAFENQKIKALKDQLVYLRVGIDTFELRSAAFAEADSFWKSRRHQSSITLKYDTLYQGLVDLSAHGYNDVALIGGKGANFAELKKIVASDSSHIPLPEYDMAIPFYHYHKHIIDNDIDDYIHTMLSDSLFKKDAEVKKQFLKNLQDKIKNAPLDPVLVAMVEQHIKSHDPLSNYRFRSSTNAEDIEGFNGAGLYDSFTGGLLDKDKTIEKAIKKTWASLWNLRAFEERTYFGIDQQSVAMAILVHRSFPDEYANGVVITHNPFNKYNSAILINVQAGENSVVRPDDSHLPDQILFYDYKISQEAYEYISHTTYPGFENKTIMTPDELKTLQKYCIAIKEHYCLINPPCKTMDIEFKLDHVENGHRLYIKQARYY